MVAKTKCKVCGTSWQGFARYCPRCGSPVLSQPSWPRVLEIALVAAAVALMLWLVVESR